jgi:hypothetical protein
VEDVIRECMEFVHGVWDKLPDDHPEKVRPMCRAI